MTNHLDVIFTQKQREVAALYQGLHEKINLPLKSMLQGGFPTRMQSTFKTSLQGASLAVIAEVKRKSPSHGPLATITDPRQLTTQYIAGGAKALSILTDETFFGGSIQDLTEVAVELKGSSVSLLRKDFIIDKIQIAQAALAGANAILLIVSLLGRNMQALLTYAHSLNLDVLVEIRDREELKIALDTGADIIGVNNRNLSTLTVDIKRAFELGPDIPSSIIKVAESGISSPALARQYYQAGFNAVLIGEALVRSTDPAQFIRECIREC